MQKISLAKIEVSTTQYKMTHGKKPRGNGLWVFEFEGMRELWFAPSEMSFGEAKKLAKIEAQKHAVSLIVVCP